ncbi:MAG: tripartite tricarboxylate transporter substrate binding protein [Alphaproteobacteria bacterium]|nr:tripartite tricarboxylate transporter substrate binding protein [Alphaproteobacteria bacterium]
MRRLSCIVAAVLCLASAATAAVAQAPYPNRPIRVLIPYGPGGLTDVVARHYAERLRTVLGQNVIVDNKPGASGIIALEQLARAAPDGYTIMIGNISTNCLTPILLAKRMTIDYDRDVQIVARTADAPVFFLSTTTNFPPATFKEFIEYVRARPGEIRYASAGIGAYQHVNTEILAKRAGGLKMIHIPFKGGGAPILRDIASGDTHVSWFNITNPVGMIKAGKVRPLAVASPQRLAAWPDVPTIDEVGFPGFHPSQWNAAFAPAGVPREIVDKLHNAFAAVAKMPEMQAIFEKGGLRAPADKSADDARAWLKREMDTWRKDIAEAGIKADE